MKRFISLLLVLLCMFLVHTACNTQSVSPNTPTPTPTPTPTETPESKEIALTTSNYSDYFYTDAYSEIESKESALGSLYFVNKVHITFDLKQTADIKNIVVKGTVDLPLDNSHLLHKENILPIPFSINIYTNGHGETNVYFQHGTGSYGGYSTTDFIINVEEISGTITLR